MPAAERYNLMPEIDRWVVEHAFQWIEMNLHCARGVSLFSINLSGHSMGDEAFMSFVVECFARHHVPGSKICFEITETMAINNMANTLRFVERFKRMDCKFSLDDFGTGFSSYGYVKTLPVDFLKIDGSFVSKIADDPIDLAMVKSINEVGHVMNRNTIAEVRRAMEAAAAAKAASEAAVLRAFSGVLGRALGMEDVERDFFAALGGSSMQARRLGELLCRSDLISGL